MGYDYQDAYNAAIGTKLLPPKQGVSGVPVWERGQFVYGAGPFAPGGPGGGMTIGPNYNAPGPSMGPGSCPQVGGGNLVCVQPPMTERGVETGRGWPPEIGPQEEQLMEVGCVATGRRCGGSARAPGQYWCCPSSGGMPMPFIGTPFPTTSGGLGDNGTEQPGILSAILIGAVGLAGAWLAMNLILGPSREMNPRRRTDAEWRRIARSHIKRRSYVAFDVASRYGQMFDNVKHMRWFEDAIVEELKGDA